MTFLRQHKPNRVNFEIKRPQYTQNTEIAKFTNKIVVQVLQTVQKVNTRSHVQSLFVLKLYVERRLANLTSCDISNVTNTVVPHL